MDSKRKISLDIVTDDWLQKNLLEETGKAYNYFKIAVDVVVGIVGLALLLLLFPCIALAITIDSPGGVVFSQERVGKNHKKFILYKFRTMHQPGGRQLSLWREKKPGTITRVGRVLRRLHLDELPQAVNLLKGQISFIGPRAEWSTLADIFENEIPYYRYRYLVKPGIIGWAQINFPPSRSVEEGRQKFEYDLYYIVHRSIAMDLEIMLKSVRLFRW